MGNYGELYGDKAKTLDPVVVVELAVDLLQGEKMFPQRANIEKVLIHCRPHENSLVGGEIENIICSSHCNESFRGGEWLGLKCSGISMYLISVA